MAMFAAMACPAEQKASIMPRMDSLPRRLQAAAAGDRHSQELLIAQLYPRVQRMVHAQIEQRLRRRGHGALARLSTGDVVQEVFAEVLRGLERWDGDDEGALVTLLATLVEHRLLDLLRRHQASRRDVRRHGDVGPATAGVGHDRTPSLAASEREQLDAYRAVLASFDDRERALLTLRIEEEIEFKTLAERLAYPSADMARKTFHALQARLLLRLRQAGVDAPGEQTS